MVALILGVAVIGAGALVAARLRHDRTALLSVAGIASSALAATIPILATLGWPAFQSRVRHATVAATTVDALTTMHRSLAQAMLTAMLFLTPILAAAAFCHATPRRRAVHLLVALAIPLFCLLATVTGYILPRHLPDPIPLDPGPRVLRFVFLHILLLPVILGTLAAVAGWRHLRAR